MIHIVRVWTFASRYDIARPITCLPVSDLANISKHLDFAFGCGVEAISLYLFSIENYKRPDEEVNSVMQNLLDRMEDIVELCQVRGVSARVSGQRDMIRPDVLAALDDAVERTKSNKR